MTNFQASILKAYFICGTQDLLPTETLPEVVEQALKAGITAYQFRDKGPQAISDKQQRLVMAQKLRQLCGQYQVPFIVDDDVELAQEVQADGIHVGQSDERIQQVITEVGDQMIVGLSCSNEQEIIAANQIKGIDYYGCGPVFATNSKADASPVIGIKGLTQLNQLAQRPIVAIGGIAADNVREVAQTGVAGSSVISMIAQSKDIAASVRQLKEN